MVEMSCIQSSTATITDANIGLNSSTTYVAYTSSGTNPVEIPEYGKTINGSNLSGCTLASGYRSIVGIIKNETTLTRQTTNKQLNNASVTIVINKIGLCVPTSNFTFNATNVGVCDSSNNVFITNIEKEYNYYFALYYYAMGKLVQALNGTASGWTSQSNAVNAYTYAAIILNRNVNDITYMITKIAITWRTTSVNALTTTINTTLESGNGSLEEQSEALMYQRSLLESGDSMLLMKEMEQYSRQKAKYHNNMLMWYSFLNITALGLLFYVYRSG
jgi:hypothetical protein